MPVATGVPVTVSFASVTVGAAFACFEIDGRLSRRLPDPTVTFRAAWAPRRLTLVQLGVGADAAPFAGPAASRPGWLVTSRFGLLADGGAARLNARSVRRTGTRGRIAIVRIITGRVVRGKIEVETPLEEGTPVAILAADKDGFQLTLEEEEELASALAAIRSGQFADGRQLLAEVRALKH